MKCLGYGILSSVFLLSSFLFTCENSKNNEKEQQEREARAQEYRELTAAMGAHVESTPKPTASPTSSSLAQKLQQDQKSKL